MPLRVGPFLVAVKEVPGSSLTPNEWRDIELARRSYAAMWGGAEDSRVLAEDRYDGTGPGDLGRPALHRVGWRHAQRRSRQARDRAR